MHLINSSWIQLALGLHKRAVKQQALVVVALNTLDHIISALDT
jgi:hypothetical protein